MIGNVDTFEHARKGQETWRPLLNNLRKGGHIYEGFPVKCERHPTKVAIFVRLFGFASDILKLCLLTLKKSPEDFDSEAPDGGCREPWQVIS